ncbi:MAG: signal transduction histidine kinase, nitrogen specific, NtrB [Chloroflexi bacterium]|jgi:nitrogen-specific signal transduction histidine kinase|nr:signal transduction histidine kinase, nitrogen specific, NtrB [Chloroflexota bacterium]
MEKDRSLQRVNKELLQASKPPDAPVSVTAQLAVLHEFAVEQGSIFCEFLYSFFDKLPQTVILADRKGQIVVFNQAASFLLDYQPGEVVGQRTLWDLCNGPTNPPAFKAAMEVGSGFPDEEVNMYPRQGLKGPFTAKIRGLYAQDGTLMGASAHLGSLVEIRAIEQERKTLRRKASIGGIVSAIAHQINNPLQTLRTSLELGLDSRKTPHHRKAYLKAADYEISRISQTINLLRHFYPASDMGKLASEVNFSIQGVLGLLDKEIKQKNLQLELDLAAGLPMVKLVNYQFQTIIINLLQSILADMPQQGILQIRSATDPLGRVQITISGTTQRPPGVTVDPFDPFANSDQDGTLALGLSISREIIAEHGGLLELTGEAPRTFNFLLLPV